jgi:hypothetical protein
MLNGWYVYGGRRTWDKETFPLEYLKIRKMVAVRDQYCWDIAQGKAVPSTPNDEGTGDLHVPPTRFGNPGQNYSEAEELRYLHSRSIHCRNQRVPPGFKIELFADETKFPDIAKPVQLNFDNKGRAWLACMPTYPQWKPGDPRPGDKLVILEDTDNDGKADVSKVFYDQLHCPTGFEFFDGGVLGRRSSLRMLFLKDTDGDDKADLVVHLMDGLGFGRYASHLRRVRMEQRWHVAYARRHCDQYHAWKHLGDPIAAKVMVVPMLWTHVLLKIRQFSLPGQYNMWCYVFNQWGQGIVGDGTTANHAWAYAAFRCTVPGTTRSKLCFQQ